MAVLAPAAVVIATPEGHRRLDGCTVKCACCVQHMRENVLCDGVMPCSFEQQTCLSIMSVLQATLAASLLRVTDFYNSFYLFLRAVNIFFKKMVKALPQFY